MASPPSPLGLLLLKLAARREGLRSLDPEIAAAGYTTAQASHKAVRLVNAGALHPVHIGHKHVRYFDTLKRAEAFQSKRSEFSTAVPTMRWLGAKAPAGPGIETEKTIYTPCPPWPGPRFQALDAFSPVLVGHR